MKALPQAVLVYIRKHELLKPGDRVGTAVSGGADSVALLRLFLDLRKELGIVLSVVHFNHQLRGTESEADEQFVAELARHYHLDFHREAGDVRAYAADGHLSLEAAARRVRYAYFRQLLREGPMNRIATAHTLDDQAETVLLRIVRGAGSRGLAGIYPQLSVVGSEFSDHRASIVRPLLGTERKDLEAYLKELGQPWREDSSNRDLRHARNRVRHGILPRLERNLNPAVRQVLAETAEIARAEQQYWEKEVERVLPSIWQVTEDRRNRQQESARAQGALKLPALQALALALRRRVVRAAAESLGLRLEFRHVEEVLGLATSPPGPFRSVVLPDNWKVSQRKDELRFERELSLAKPSGYEYRLPVPGVVEVSPLGSRFEAVLVSGKRADVYNPEHLLNRALLGEELLVRNWRAGDRFWPAHTKAPRKVKELLQGRHLIGPEKKLWPVVADGMNVIWVRGFPAPSRLQPRDVSGQMVVIREVPLTGNP